jgi:hypothetical protein
MEWRREERAYFDEALGALKKEADANGLRVDSSATEELRTIIDTALERVERIEGADAFSPQHHAQFDEAIVSIAEAATKVAQQDDGPYVMAEHLEAGFQDVEASLGWPWDGGDE